MLKTTKYLVIEFFLLFILLPISLAIDYNIWVKTGSILVGFIYIIVILKRVERISFRTKKPIAWKDFWKRTGVIFLMIMVVTTGYVLFSKASNLFYVPRTDPWLVVKILFIYTFFSVLPQGLIYRTFFFNRYERLFKNKSLFIFISAIIFSLGHLFFKNTLVLILTFIGGIIFGLTYIKFRNNTLVNIEHSLYGNWLFVVGMGQMLMFPGMPSTDG